MQKLMEQIDVKSLNAPEEVRKFDKGRLEFIKIGDKIVGRATLEPGWKWSESVQPITKTKSCEAAHLQYQISGVLKIVMDDGGERELRAGDVSMIPPGHNSWVVGNEPVVLIDFQGMTHYAQKLNK